jgi:hypothetical protein
MRARKRTFKNAVATGKYILWVLPQTHSVYVCVVSPSVCISRRSPMYLGNHPLRTALDQERYKSLSWRCDWELRALKYENNLGPADPSRWRHYAPSKPCEPITQWYWVIPLYSVVLPYHAIFSIPQLFHLAYLAVLSFHMNTNSVSPRVGCTKNHSQTCSVIQSTRFKKTIFH